MCWLYTGDAKKDFAKDGLWTSGAFVNRVGPCLSPSQQWIKILHVSLNESYVLDDSSIDSDHCFNVVLRNDDGRCLESRTSLGILVIVTRYPQNLRLRIKLDCGCVLLKDHDRELAYSAIVCLPDPASAPRPIALTLKSSTSRAFTILIVLL